MSPSLNSAARERWLARLRRYRQSSGLTIAEFCRAEGVSVPSFYQWKKKLSAAPDETTDSSRKFAAVVVTRADHPSVITLRLPGGASMELPDSLGQEQLTKVLLACMEATQTDAERETDR